MPQQPMHVAAVARNRLSETGLPELNCCVFYFLTWLYA